jgi:hypothetical protein
MLPLFAAVNGAAAQSAVDSVRVLDSAWARAYATHDTTLALALFAPDLVVASANGSLKSREDALGDVRSQPGLRMQYFRTSEVDLRVYVAGGPLGWRLVALHIGRAP